jgi:hypothetical protein
VTLQQPAPAVPAAFPQSPDRTQREHELLRAYDAARLLEERLEMCIGSPAAALVSDARRIRQALFVELLALEAEVPG